MGFLDKFKTQSTTLAAPVYGTASEDKVSDYTAKAGISLVKAGVGGLKAAVYLNPDHSGSMDGFYANGDVQDLAERILGLSRNLDDDGSVPVSFWDSRLHKPFEVSLDNYQGIVDREHKKIAWGSTNYGAVIRGAAKLHRKESVKKDGEIVPGLVIVQTDGQPDSKQDAEMALREVSGEPLLFFFVGFGDPKSRVFDFLKTLDVLPGRRVDNAAFFPAGRAPQELDVTELYDAIITEYKKYLSEAKAAGIL